MAHLNDIDNVAPADSLKAGADTLNTWRGRIDTLNDALGDITSAEADQIENIGTVTISNTQWGYLGACVAGGGQLLAALTTGESTQLEAIGATTITATQWGYLGACTAAGGALLDDADASAQRTTLGLAIGTDVLAYDAGLSNLAGISMAADKFYYTSADNTHVAGTITAFGRSIIDDADEATFKGTVNLEIGTDVQAYDADLSAIAALAKTDSNFIVGNGSAWVAESGATARTSLGLGSMAIQAHGSVNIDGGTIGGITLDGAIAGGDQTFTNIGNMTFAAGSILASGNSNTDTLILKANDTTCITLTTAATDQMDLAAVYSLVAINNLDIGAYTFRCAGLIDDSLTSGRIVTTTTNGQLADSAELAWSSPCLTLSTADTDDPCMIFKTTNATISAHEVRMWLDESDAHDHVKFEGQTASVDTCLHMKAQDGQLCRFRLYSGANYSSIIHGAADHLSIINSTEDANLLLGINDGGANKTITWNAADDRLEHSAGTFNFHDDNLTTSGTLTATTIGAFQATGAIDFNDQNMTSVDIDSGTIGGVTLDGAVAGGDQAFTGVGDMTFTNGSILKSGSTGADTLLLAANDTTFITLTTGTPDTLGIGAFTLSGKLTAGANEIEGSVFDIDGGDISAATISGGLTWSAAQNFGAYNHFINDTANTFMTTGLTINQGGADNEIVAGKSSDVTTPFTAIAEADTFAVTRKVANDEGGASYEGFSSGARAVQFVGYGVTDTTTKATSSVGYINVTAVKTDGSTGGGVTGANANLVAFRNYGTTTFLFDAEGSAHAEVEWTTFQDHNDLALIDDLEDVMLIHQKKKSNRFGNKLKAKKKEFQDNKLVHFEEDSEHMMINLTKLNELEIGAIRQIHKRLKALEA